MSRILVVDDEENMRELVTDILSRDGHKVASTSTGERALKRLEKKSYDLVVLDLRLPGMDGMETLREIRKLKDSLPPEVIIITAHATMDAAVEAMRAGAVDFLVKPFEPETLRSSVRRALSVKKAYGRAAGVWPEVDMGHFFLTAEDDILQCKPEPKLGVVGRSALLLEILAKIEKIAGTSATVLITGETGSGKEVMARALHLSSERRGEPFVSINCAALPDTLVENELFGHERGAYTDARTRQAGKVAQAEGGTLFLDEVGDLSAVAQAKLLRLIEEREYVPLGGMHPVKADVRIVAATHRNLSEMVQHNIFRDDLFWRLRVVPIHIPALRERGEEDIMELAEHFMDEFEKKYNRPRRGFYPDKRRRMAAYSWPGNVRELRNYVERYFLLGEETLLAVGVEDEQTSDPGVPTRHRIVSLEHSERSIIIDALRWADGDKKLAAQNLGISIRSLYYKIKKYDILTKKIVR